MPAPTFTTTITVHCSKCEGTKTMEVPLTPYPQFGGDDILAVDDGPITRVLLGWGWKSTGYRTWAHAACVAIETEGP